MRWWIGVTLVGALALSYFGLAFAIDGSPQSVWDYLVWGWLLLMSLLYVAPASAVCAVGMATLVEWFHGPPSVPDQQSSEQGLVCDMNTSPPGRHKSLSRGTLVAGVVICLGLAIWALQCVGLDLLEPPEWLMLIARYYA